MTEYKKDLHGTEATTKWIHKHRTTAKWLMKALILALTSALFYLKKEEKEIEKESDRA